MENKAKSKDKKMTPKEMINEKSKNRRNKSKKGSNESGNAPSNVKKWMSPKELLELMAVVENEFIRPTSQDILGGDEGMTLYDVSKSLGAEHAVIRRKIERNRTVEYLTALNHKIMPNVILTAEGKMIDTFVLDIASIQHVVSSYNNERGWLFRDFLIRCKDALKVSLKSNIKLEKELESARTEIADANKKIDLLTQPKITRRNNIVVSKIVPEKSGLFHDTTYKIERQLIKQPRKEDPSYKEVYLQKLANITNGNVKAMLSALKSINCNREILNRRMGQLAEASSDIESLINPKDGEEYNELVKKIEREIG